MVLKWFANLFSSSKKAGNKQHMSSDDESFEEYSKSHGLDTLYAELATALDTHRPADPHSFLCEYFDNRKFTSNNSKEKSQNLEVGCFVKRDCSRDVDLPAPAVAKPQATPPTSPSKVKVPAR